jgi:hypothetical protein
MVKTKKIIKTALATLFFGLSVFVSFVAQLYAPTILWVLSAFALIYVTVASFIIYRKEIRIIGTCACSLVICASYLFYSVTGGSLRDFAFYGLTLWATTWLILFFLSETIASLVPKRLR